LPRVILISWKAEEAESRVNGLRAAGVDATVELPAGPEFLKMLEAAPPGAIVIDLDRRPSHGREIGLWLRQRKAVRSIPLVFAGGAAERVAAVRALLPDAAFTEWDKAAEAVRAVLAAPPPKFARPPSIMAPYAGRPLVKKLGLQPGRTVSLIGAPPGFEAALGELPEAVRLEHYPDLMAWAHKPGSGGEALSAGRSKADVALWFLRRRQELEDGIAAAAGALGHDTLWICWPKRGSTLAADVTQNHVRAAGLAAGLVDFKICAVDADWSGLCFVLRRAKGRGWASSEDGEP
jgi:hypothetical protein